MMKDRKLHLEKTLKDFIDIVIFYKQKTWFDTNDAGKWLVF